MKLRNVWLLLAIVGAVAPWYFLFGYFSENSISPSAFIAAAAANDAAAAFVADLVISSIVFWICMYSRRPTGPPLWPFVLINLFIGLSCALPAYLWAASRPTAEKPA